MPTFRRTRFFTISAAAILTTMTTTSISQNIDPYKNPKLSIEQRVDDLLSRMTIEEKVALCAGKAGDCTKDIPRLGIPSLRVTDGPHGVGWGVKATCFPTAVSMGASWNPELIRLVGVALAEETRAQNRHVLLGPCINIHRTPLGGRNFESFGEDPYLSGRLAIAYVKGMQSRKIGTSVKHYACNNQEFERCTISVEIDERALREIYLPAFKAAVQEADPWTVMGAYNKVRGKWCCENPHLLKDILKDEWGFKGVVVSDWGATHSVADAANAGLDLEMPGPGEYFTAKLVDAVKKGDVKEPVVDDKAGRILRVMFLAGLFDAPDPSLKDAMNTEEHAALARRLAEEAIVLLKNDGNVLPLNREKIKSIAVIGPSAETARLGGGGSSNVEGWRPISPLEGLRRKCGTQIEVRYDPGCDVGLLMIPAGVLVQPDGKSPGLKAEYFSNQNLEGHPALVRIDDKVDFQWGNGSPDTAIPNDHFSARWTGKLVAPASGQYEIGVTSDDGCRMYLDGKPVIDSWIDQAGIPRTATVTLEAGKSYDIRLEYFENLGAASARLCWGRPDRSFKEAIKMAKESDAAIVFVGLSSQFEGEGCDRNDMNLPGEQDELIEAIMKANKNTIVVLVSGTPVDMRRWIGQVPAVLEAWYPGQEGGNAIANILFGDVNPSGKLPMTFPKKLEDNPSYGNFPGSDGIVRYVEGIFVGYRYYDTKNVEPLFPFGHGLSYTTFKYSDLKIEQDPKAPALKISASLNVKNAGARAGAEVVQLYVRDIESSLERPAKEIKGFKKISLQPGETTQVTFELGERDLAFYDPERGRWVAEPGEFEILIGSGSRDIRLKGTYVFRGE